MLCRKPWDAGGRLRLGSRREPAKELDVTQWKTVGLLVVLGIGWGATQPLGKIAASTGHGPFALIFWQLAICTLVLGAITLVRGRGLRLTRRALVFYLVVALLGP